MNGILKPHFLKAKINTNAKIRREKFDDVEHLILPVIAAQEMVMNDLFYPAEEFQQWANTWNGIPIPVRHPQINGIFISAKSPRIHEQNNIGWFYNVEFTDDKKLKGEIWLNLEKIEKLGHQDIVSKFESGEIMEVSTGLFSNIENTPGEFNGVPYKGIVRNIRPDHLALLPDEVGACSIAAGCGAMRTNENCECKEPKNNKTDLFKAFRLLGEKIGLTSSSLNLNDEHGSLFDIIDQLNNLLRIEFNGPDLFVWIVDVFETEVIYSLEDRGEIALFKRSYSVSDGKVTLGDDIQKVEKKVTFDPVMNKNKSINNGGKNMDKDELVKEIIGNEANIFSKEDKEKLSALDEGLLGKINAKHKEDDKKKKSQENKEDSPDKKTKSFLENIEDTEVKEFLDTAVSEHNEKKKETVDRVVKNSQFSESDLEKFSLNDLEKLDESTRPADFSGRGSTLTKNKIKHETPSINVLGSKPPKKEGE